MKPTIWRGRDISQKRKHFCILAILQGLVLLLISGQFNDVNFFGTEVQLNYDSIADNTKTEADQFISVDDSTRTTGWSEKDIVNYMEQHPSRAYFSRFFRNGSFRRGMEVGVADGRFSEHFLLDLKSIWGLEWTMVEPYPNGKLIERYNPNTGEGNWQKAGLLNRVQHIFWQTLSLDKNLLRRMPEDYYDFIYLDGDHSYEGVKQEMFEYWPKVRPGGVLAGHDYCNLGEPTLNCNGCDIVPKCRPYTELGLANGKKNNLQGTSTNQNDVVKAVQEWMVENNDPRMKLRYTKENFTREGLSADGIDYDLLLTNTRTPSWYIVKSP